MPPSTAPPLTNPGSSWSVASASYAERVGRMSAHSCKRLIEITHEALPLSAPRSYILDNGAGTGTLTTEATTAFPGIRVLAADIAPGMLSVIDAKEIPNVATRVVDAAEPGGLGRQEGDEEAFSHAFSTFMVMFTLQPMNVLQEIYRVLQPGGAIGLAVWGEKIGPNTVWEEACQLLEPAYTLPSPYADPNAWRTEREVRTALEKAGFCEVKTEVWRVPFEFEDTESYIRFWYGAKNPVAERFKASSGGNQEEAKEALRRVLKERYNDATSIFGETVLAVGRKLGSASAR